ncbi:MAG: 7TM-DISM domain-containing protein [Cyclobacteriaceae bacterium]|nr:7TM-DISM domain-containing protein [Cyclobacteriaceae bacterium]
MPQSVLTLSHIFLRGNRYIIFLLLVFLSPLLYSQNSTPIANYGTLDLSHWDFEEQGNIKLDGTWSFYWNQLLSPTDFSTSNPSDKSYFDFPNIWNKYQWKDQKLPSKGYATFVLEIVGSLKDLNLAMEIPSLYCSYNLWIDGKLIANNGVPGINKEKSTPQWIPYTKTFTATGDTISIVLNVSNFHHYKGGMNDSILLGSPKYLLAKRNSDVWANMLMIIGIGILTIISLMFYFQYRNVLILYFTFFSLTWTVRGLFTNMYLINYWFPDFNWALGTKVEYLTLYFSLLLGIMIVGKMFTEHTNSISQNASIIINSIFIGITIFFPTTVFSKTLTTYLIFLSLFMVYIVATVVNALIHDSKGAGYISFTILIIISLFFYDLFSHYNLISNSPYISSIGYLVVYYLNGFALWYKIMHTKNLSKQPTEDNSSSYLY